MPEKNQFFIGGQTYSVLKRYLIHDYGKMRSLQHFLLISYGLTDWFSVDLKGGAGYIKQHPGSQDEIDYPTYVGGGYGFRIKAFDKNKTKVIFGFQHISIHPYSIEVNNVKHKAVLDDWQWSLLASYEFPLCTPYLGTRWSRMDYIHWTDDVRKLKKSDVTKSVGAIIGVDIPLGEKFWINLEGQFVDAEAVAASINFRF